MKPEIKAKWVAALRSGEYQQCEHVLHDGEAFCCLGVLTDLYAKEHGIEWVESAFSDAEAYCLPDDKGEWEVLPLPVRVWAGLEPHVGDPELMPAPNQERKRASALNDEDGFTFAQIADAIEATV